MIEEEERKHYMRTIDHLLYENVELRHQLEESRNIPILKPPTTTTKTPRMQIVE